MLAERATDAAAPGSVSTQRLPARDWLLLPLLSLGTILLLLATAELLARHFWPAQEEDTCFRDGRFQPFCSSVVKIPEGEWSTDTYNDCGYRSRYSCHKAPGAYRIVMLGSSAAHGLYLPVGKTFATLVENQLSTQLHRAVDVQNLGIPNTTPTEWHARLLETTKLQPDAVVFVLTPFDVEQIGADQGPASPPPSAPGFYKRIQHSVTESRAALVAQHVLFSDRERFLRFYLLYGDRADYLRTPLTPAWQQRYQQLDAVLGRTAIDLQAAHVPFYLLLLPSRAEATLMHADPRPPRTDAFSYRDQVAAIARTHAVHLIDCVNGFAQRKDPEQLFYVVDGHVNPEGQAIIARQVTEAMLAH